MLDTSRYGGFGDAGLVARRKWIAYSKSTSRARPTFI